MLTCKDMRDGVLLSRVICDEATKEEQRRFAKHLAECEYCQKTYDLFQQGKEAQRVESHLGEHAMSWTHEPIERFINALETEGKISQVQAQHLKVRLNRAFGGENTVSTDVVQGVFSDFDGFFDELKERFGEFIDGDDFLDAVDAMSDEALNDES